jgi:hypothetical protein
MDRRKQLAVLGDGLCRDVPFDFGVLGKPLHCRSVRVKRRLGFVSDGVAGELQELQRLTGAGLLLSCGAADGDGEQHRACWDNAVAQHGGLYMVSRHTLARRDRRLAQLRIFSRNAEAKSGAVNHAPPLGAWNFKVCASCRFSRVR